MTNGIFVDTAGWASLVDQSQEFHAETAVFYREARARSRQMVTTNYVITEVVALLASPLRLPRVQIIAFITSLRQSPYIQFVPIDEARDDAAWTLLSNRPDKNWSLVDCASFVVMSELGLTDALTSDHHFEQAGFVRLLKSQSKR